MDSDSPSKCRTDKLVGGSRLVVVVGEVADESGY